MRTTVLVLRGQVKPSEVKKKSSMIIELVDSILFSITFSAHPIPIELQIYVYHIIQSASLKHQ